MELFSVVMVDRDADWSRWASVQQEHGHSVVVLVRQSGERAEDFRARAEARLERLKEERVQVAQILDLSGVAERAQLRRERDALGPAVEGAGFSDVSGWSRRRARQLWARTAASVPPD